MTGSQQLVAAIVAGIALSGTAHALDTATIQLRLPANRELPGGLEEVVGQLNLSAKQKSRIEHLYSEAQAGFLALETVRESTQQLLALTPPNDSEYASILAAAKENAADAVQIRSDLWIHIFGELTIAQRARLPGIFTAHKVASSVRKLASRGADSAS